VRFTPALFLLFLIACQPVREDRTIEFSGDGEEVGFQHGVDGIYVADGDGGTLEKIHDPDQDVIATSTPQFAPDDKRLIFCTAEPIGEPRRTFNIFDPAGALHQETPVIYTCWLRRPGAEGPAPKPEVLFRARAGHGGYVAANLAVRWHPSGEAVLYIDEDGKNAHGVFRFDLRTQRRTRVFHDKPENVVFDFAPDGRLVCVTPEGVHVQTEDGWWTIPAPTVKEEAGAKIEALRSRRPAFSPDGKRFAFASRADEKEYLLALGTVADQAVATVARGERPYRDLKWSPDGKRLGVVRGDTLHFLENRMLSSGVGERTVRRFAGWNARGDTIAYTSPVGPARAGKTLWSFLLAPDPRARDAVIVGGKRVFSDMRVTFPKWSPTDDKLSVWFTFSPTHRSLLAMIVGIGLRPGDPAAIFTPKTGDIAWMAVNSHEREQIGHYHLLRGENAEALKWYERAVADRKPVDRDELAVLVRGGRPHDIELFESICLARLGMAPEAAAKRAAFDRRFTRRRDTPFLDDFLALLARDLYVAEVYLSLDAAAAGEADLRAAVAARKGDERLSACIVLGQQLLLKGDHAEYAELMTDVLSEQERRPLPGDSTFILPISMLALTSPDFVATLTEKQRASLLRRWRAARPNVGNVARMLAYFRRAAGEDVELPQHEAEGVPWLDDPEAAIRTLRALMTRSDALMSR
jgi:hypothetical protein